MDASNHSLTQKLESFLESTRNLENTLGEEKKRSHKIAQEYLTTRSTLENAIHELKNRLSQREAALEALTQKLVESNAREKKITANLLQFQTAWNEVLAREAHARKYVAEFEKARKVVAEQRNQIKNLEDTLKTNHENTALHSRRAETAERELQGATGRLQNAEAKLVQAQQALASATQGQRSTDQEVARLELVFQNQFKQQIGAEKKRIQSEISAQFSAEQEQFRDKARAQMRSEIERQVSAIERQIATERQGREAAQIELNQTRSQLNALEAEKKIEAERARSRLLALTEENHALKEEIRLGTERKLGEIAALKREMALVQMNVSSSQTAFETTKKEMNKSALVERLRHDAETRELRQKIERLIEHGVLAEKLDTIPTGETIFTATPVNTRSRDTGTFRPSSRTL